MQSAIHGVAQGQQKMPMGLPIGMVSHEFNKVNILDVDKFKLLCYDVNARVVRRQCRPGFRLSMFY